MSKSTVTQIILILFKKPLKCLLPSIKQTTREKRKNRLVIKSSIMKLLTKKLIFKNIMKNGLSKNYNKKIQIRAMLI